MTTQVVRILYKIMQTKTQKAGDDLYEAFKEKYAAAMGLGGHAATSGSGRGKGAVDEAEQAGGLRRTLDSLREESSQLVDQVVRGEKAAIQAWKKVADPAAVKQVCGNKYVKAAIEQELKKWRDKSLWKAALKAVEERQFADRFADGLLARPGGAAAPLLDALQPTRGQLQEALQQDLCAWLGGSDARHLKALLHDMGLAQAKGAIELAMAEVAAQSGAELDRILESTKDKADARKLFKACSGPVCQAVQREVRSWEAQLRRSEVLLPLRVAPEPADLLRARQGLAGRLRMCLQPITGYLDAMSEDIQLTGYMIRLAAGGGR